MQQAKCWTSLEEMVRSADVKADQTINSFYQEVSTKILTKETWSYTGDIVILQILVTMKEIPE